MKRRSFITALAGLPVVGFGARAFGRPKPAEKSGITVHGPEWLNVNIYGRGSRPTLSLRFENVPLQAGEAPRQDLLARLRSIGGVVNRRDWHWLHNRDEPEDLPVLNTHFAETLMLSDFGFSQPVNGLTSVMCAFTPASEHPPWLGSHRPVDFETEILKALGG